MTGKGYSALVGAMLAVFGVIVGVMLVISLFSMVLPWYLSVPVAGGAMWFVLTKTKFGLRDKVWYTTGGLSFLVTTLVTMPFSGPFMAGVWGLVGLIVCMYVSYHVLKAVVRNSPDPARWTD